jgi:hypothetical protein
MTITHDQAEEAMKTILHDSPSLEAYQWSIDALRAYIAQNREAAAVSGWQPIETAPKDGSRLWLYWPTRNETDRQSVGWWHESVHGCWWMDPADTESEGPTHWRELPAPPQKEG